MKAQRKDMCTQLLERYNAEAEAFLQRILIEDESWIHHYDPECKTQSMEYRRKTSPSPRKFKVVASARKVLFTVFWNMEEVVQMKTLEQGQTVTLSDIFQHSKLSNSDSDVFGVIRTQSCNMQMRAAHQSPTRDALRQVELATLPHPTFSPDLAPSDYNLFPQLKKYLKGHYYDNE
ncbi:transposase [Plakobranchus ocellatus]|uniref:Transposase n=1 Tax=Plakobranchus ocellatus TaxID=259542 RepID=A0AAV4D8H0_9GAST|nr:transposase [Plakobranchus ocellatus]